MTLIMGLFIYILLAIATYFLLGILINLNRGTDLEFDEAMDKGSAKMLALLVCSLIWPITIIFIIINNIKEEIKNGRN